MYVAALNLSAILCFLLLLQRPLSGECHSIVKRRADPFLHLLFNRRRRKERPKTIQLVRPPIGGVYGYPPYGGLPVGGYQLHGSHSQPYGYSYTYPQETHSVSFNYDPPGWFEADEYGNPYGDGHFDFEGFGPFDEDEYAQAHEPKEHHSEHSHPPPQYSPPPENEYNDEQNDYSSSSQSEDQEPSYSTDHENEPDHRDQQPPYNTDHEKEPDNLNEPQDVKPSRHEKNYSPPKYSPNSKNSYNRKPHANYTKRPPLQHYRKPSRYAYPSKNHRYGKSQRYRGRKKRYPRNNLHFRYQKNPHHSKKHITNNYLHYHPPKPQSSYKTLLKNPVYGKLPQHADTLIPTQNTFTYSPHVTPGDFHETPPKLYKPPLNIPSTPLKNHYHTTTNNQAITKHSILNTVPHSPVLSPIDTNPLNKPYIIITKQETRPKHHSLTKSLQHSNIVHPSINSPYQSHYSSSPDIHHEEYPHNTPTTHSLPHSSLQSNPADLSDFNNHLQPHTTNTGIPTATSYSHYQYPSSYTDNQASLKNNDAEYPTHEHTFVKTSEHHDSGSSQPILSTFSYSSASPMKIKHYYKKPLHQKTVSHKTKKPDSLHHLPPPKYHSHKKILRNQQIRKPLRSFPYHKKPFTKNQEHVTPSYLKDDKYDGMTPLKPPPENSKPHFISVKEPMYTKENENHHSSYHPKHHKTQLKEVFIQDPKHHKTQYKEHFIHDPKSFTPSAPLHNLQEGFKPLKTPPHDLYKPLVHHTLKKNNDISHKDISGITKDAIYRGDYPDKGNANQNSKGRVRLMPGGYKGLDPVTVDFIKQKTRLYGYQR